MRTVIGGCDAGGGVIGVLKTNGSGTGVSSNLESRRRWPASMIDQGMAMSTKER